MVFQKWFYLIMSDIEKCLPKTQGATYKQLVIYLSKYGLFSIIQDKEKLQNCFL